MTDTCVIKRASGETMDSTTLEMVPAFTTVYTGKCRVQLRDSIASTPSAGERIHVVQRAVVQAPISATGVLVDDVVEITAAGDPDLVGNKYRVRSQFAKTHATMRRLECEESQA